MGIPIGSIVKNLLASMGDTVSIPGSGRSPAEGNGNPLQCSCLGNSRTEDPGGLQSMGSQRVRQNWACMHAQLGKLLNFSTSNSSSIKCIL